MACEHKNLRTVGDRLFCKDCKEELPIEFLIGAVHAKQGEKPQESGKAGKAPARKRVAKKAE